MGRTRRGNRGRGLLLLSLGVGAAGHGVLTTPLARSSPTGAPVPGRFQGPGFPDSNWFNSVKDGPNATVVAGAPTNCDPRMLTDKPFSCLNSRGLPRNFLCADAKVRRPCPWYAPGAAPIASPCGIELDLHAPRYPAHGQDGRALPPTAARVQWRAGDSAEVAWTPAVNHGGGYGYRLVSLTSFRLSARQ